MTDPNISFGDPYSYEQYRNFDPPFTKITYKHIDDIYTLCDEAKKSGFPKSEIYLNISTLLLGITSILGCFDVKGIIILGRFYVKDIIIVLLLAIAILIWLMYFKARQEDANNIRRLASDICSLMPMTREDIKSATEKAHKIDDLLIRKFEQHSKQPYQ